LSRLCLADRLTNLPKCLLDRLSFRFRLLALHDGAPDAMIGDTTQRARPRPLCSAHSRGWNAPIPGGAGHRPVRTMRTANCVVFRKFHVGMPVRKYTTHA